MYLNRTQQNQRCSWLDVLSDAHSPCNFRIWLEQFWPRKLGTRPQTNVLPLSQQLRWPARREKHPKEKRNEGFHTPAGYNRPCYQTWTTRECLTNSAARDGMLKTLFVTILVLHLVTTDGQQCMNLSRNGNNQNKMELFFHEEKKITTSRKIYFSFYFSVILYSIRAFLLTRIWFYTKSWIRNQNLPAQREYV